MKEKYLLIKVPKNQKGCEGCHFDDDQGYCKDKKETCPIHNGVEVERRTALDGLFAIDYWVHVGEREVKGKRKMED